MFKKIPIFTLMIIVLIIISISLLNFDDLSWDTNAKYYLGLIVAGLMLIVKFSFKLK